MHCTAVWRGSSVLLAWLAADISPPAIVGDVPDLLHIHVPHRARVVMLVAANGLTGGAVEKRESIQAGAAQDPVHSRRRYVEPRGKLDQAFA